MSSKDFTFTKEELDDYLKELGKQFRKLTRKSCEAELILIGGAAILVDYGFRQMTNDVDAVIRAASSMKDASNFVRDKFALPDGWLNDDFVNTASFTPKLAQYSKPYRIFANVLKVRIVSAEYLVAMKLKAGRPYKHDRSDVVGILAEHEKKGEPIPLETVKTAVQNLYGSWESLTEEMREFAENVYSSGDLDRLYEKVKAEEARSKDILLEFQQDYPGVTNKKNVNDILAAMKKKRPLHEQIQDCESHRSTEDDDRQVYIEKEER